MDSAAQPLSFGQILDRAFRLCRANLKNFLAISIVPGLGYLAIFVAILGPLSLVVWPDRATPPSWNPAMVGLIIAVSLVAFVGVMLVFAIFQPAACYAVLQADLGISTGFSGAYAKSWSKAGRYVWLIVLKGLIIAGPTYGAGILIAVLSLFRARVGGSAAESALLVAVPLLMLVYVVGMVYAVLMMIRLALATPACVAEDLPALAAIRRSIRLSRGAKSRIFLVGLVTYAINCAAMVVFEVVFGLFASLGALLFALLHINRVIEIVLASVFGVLFLGSALLLMGAMWSSFVVVFTLVYRDRRLRIEPQPVPEAAV